MTDNKYWYRNSLYKYKLVIIKIIALSEIYQIMNAKLTIGHISW